MVSIMSNGNNQIKKSSEKNNNTEKIMQSVIKLFVQKSTPNYSMPWQMKRQQHSTGSGFVISGKRILTNAHVVAYQKSVRVRKHGDAKKYTAHVLHVAHECDIAVIGVSDESFWDNLEELEFGDIPQLEEDIVVVGFPTGGDNISVTRGVVSRVDIQRYSHSGTYLLAIQIDAAINSGNSGGPAIKDGKVTGVAFETLENAENIGYIIPVPVVKHFLEDIDRHQNFTGFCDLGIQWQPIESDHMRLYFKLATKDTGILVARISKLSCSYQQLQRGDILMAVDENIIADDGTVPFRGHERILWNYIIHSKFSSDKVKVKVSRAGSKLEIELDLTVATFLVPPQLYDRRPSYVVYCGLVFTSLSQPYMLHQYGKDWGRKAPIRLCDRILYGIKEKQDQEVIILSQVLASELTAGYDSFSNLQIYRVNGIPILNLKHLCHLLDKLTLPHTSKKNVEQIPENTSNPIKLEIGGSVNTSELKEIIDTKEDDGTCNEVKSLSDREKESYTSFSVIDDNKEIDEERNVPSQQTNDNISVTEFERSFSEFTSSTQNLYYSVSDDPLLLDCKNYIHFELDKDKIIVFDILTACKNNSKILKQYAITLPRSENLPLQPFDT